MQNDNKPSLFMTLQKLQAKLAVAFVKIRRRSYHAAFKTNNSFNITSMLAQQVDELALSVSKMKASTDSSIGKQEPPIGHLSKENNDKDYQVDVIENSSAIETEFSKYLKDRKHALVTNRYIGDKLQESVWEHIHSAIRHARQGDTETAKLHSKIAGDALEESGHFLSNDDYSDLVYQISHYFSDAQKDKKDSH